MNPIVKTQFRENLQYLATETWKRSFYTVPRAGKVHADASYRVERSSYPGQDILYCISGRGTVRTAGTLLQVRTGQVAWIDCETPHAHWADAADPWTLLWFRLDGPDLANCRIRLWGNRAPVVSVTDGALLTVWFERLFGLLRLRESHIDLKLHIQVAAFFVMLGEALDGGSDAAYPASLRYVLKGLRAQPNREWSSSDLEQIGGKSAAHLRRLFRTHLHTTPRHWLTRERVMLAQKLLLDGDISIANVAEKCGFSDVYHFGREFKKNVGISPSAWRRSERGIAQTDPLSTA